MARTFVNARLHRVGRPSQCPRHYLCNGQFIRQIPFNLQVLPSFAWRTRITGLTLALVWVHAGWQTTHSSPQPLLSSPCFMPSFYTVPANAAMEHSHKKHEKPQNRIPRHSLFSYAFVPFRGYRLYPFPAQSPRRENVVPGWAQTLITKQRRSGSLAQRD